jgi:anti-sigma-K factor RskA
MIDDVLQTQAALYALGALPAGEATAFRAKLFENPELAALVSEYEAAAAGLAEIAPRRTPPPYLRENILAAVASPKPAERAPAPWLPWALAAAFAAAAGVLWLRGDKLSADSQDLLAKKAGLDRAMQSANADISQKTQALAELRKQIATLQTADTARARRIADLEKLVAELETRSAVAETQVATLTSKLDATYLASIAWDGRSQEGVLHVRRLPATAQNQDYQLWVVDPEYKLPVSAGVFKVQPDGSATLHFSPVQRVRTAAGFAITLERAGGVPKAEGPVMLSN